MKAILVTGASSGIGYSIAKEFANHGYHVFGSIRRKHDADRLITDIGANVTPLLFDVTDLEAIQQAVQQVEGIVKHYGLVGLINNAGIGTAGPLMHQPLDEIRHQFEVNVIGQIAVIQAFLPLLGASKQSRPNPGRIINISSVAGKSAPAFLGAYVGSKHAIEGISHSLRRELQLYGIDVVIIGPGAVNTPIWDKELAQDASRYAETDYAEPIRRFQTFFVESGKQGYSPAVVGEFVRKVFERQKPKARYALVPNAIQNWYIPRILPTRWLDRIIGKKLHLFDRTHSTPNSNS
ncbi:SDR family oxidoreductase [Hassallia byssoidea VB512170]|uniref:SDR family oxidoreductase n=1 Tax=Hassallia byssoidea VB512170 TaxID=1304833 RepID=A0A846HEJ0_9CYAN|nr:SDR family oxidoreductase [Hassalia byssoidea VB512170]